MKIVIKGLKTRIGERGEHYQGVRVQVVSRDGSRFWKDAWVPVDADRDPWPPGRYQWADNSFYVNRFQGVSFYPRLEFVADLEDDSGPGDVPAAVPVRPVAEDIPF